MSYKHNKNQRYSAKRELIKQTIMQYSDLVSAETIWLQLRNQRVHISAVYISLKELTAAGFVSKHSYEGRKNLFLVDKYNRNTDSITLRTSDRQLNLLPSTKGSF